jgi:hypothetical protein
MAKRPPSLPLDSSPERARTDGCFLCHRQIARAGGDDQHRAFGDDWRRFWGQVRDSSELVELGRWKTVRQRRPHPGLHARDQESFVVCIQVRGYRQHLLHRLPLRKYDLREPLSKRAMVIDGRERERFSVRKCELTHGLAAVELSARNAIEKSLRALAIHAASVSASCSAG